MPKEDFRHRTSFSFQTRRSVLDIDRYRRKYDHDVGSRGFTRQHATMQFLYNTPTTAATKAPIKIHKPREDPRLFYQSDLYLQEVNRKNLSPELSSTYLGRAVVRTGGGRDGSAKPIRIKTRTINEIPHDISCIKCPRDRTLIAKVGVSRVMLQPPRLQTCSGRKAPRDFKFVTKYGPKLGTLIESGVYIMIGHIVYQNQILRACKVQIHVVTQFCQVPKYLNINCDRNQNRTCSFTCRDPTTEPTGANSLTCRDDLKWNGHLPSCNVRSWCKPPFPPSHGRISCNGATVSSGRGLKGGSTCKLKCDKGWRKSSHSVTKCHRGSWTHELSCQNKNRKR